MPQLFTLISSLSHREGYPDDIGMQIKEKTQLRTAEDFVFADHVYISHLTGVDIKMLRQLAEQIEEICSATPWNALDYHKRTCNSLAILSSGSRRIDDLLDGGVYSSQLTELYGEPSTGKTQFCFSVCSRVVAETPGSVVWIDTSNSFSPVRIIEICQHYEKMTDQTIEKALSKIQCFVVSDVFALIDILEALKASLMQSDSSRLKLVVIDSLGSLLNPTLTGSISQSGQQYTLGHSLMMTIARLMKYIASAYNVAFLYTNYSTTDRESSLRKAGLGESWALVPDTQLFLSYHPLNGTRQIMLTTSTRKTTNTSTTFMIGEEGVKDVQ